MKLPPLLLDIIDGLASILTPDRRKQASIVYAQLMQQSRHPWFYEKAKVPDTLDGRFETLVLHMFIFLRRWRDGASYEGEYDEFEQAILGFMFDDMDQMLREMGVGDVGVPRRIKAMGEALYGRFEAYEASLQSQDDVQDALLRNVYSVTDEPSDTLVQAVEKLQRYFGLLREHFAQEVESRLMNGILHMPEPKKLLSNG